MSDKTSPFAKIKISKMVSTIILSTTFTTILLFGLIFYMYYEPNTEYTVGLKESFSITASFFGGIATLVAAYIASQLFNDWREIHNQTTYQDIFDSIFKTQTKLNVKLVSINDSFHKARNNHQIDNEKYDTEKISEIIEKDVQETGDLLCELLYQIVYIQKLNKGFKQQLVEEFEDLILDYMGIMDISYYRTMNDHLEFIKQEQALKSKWDNLEGRFLDLLAEQAILKF